MTVVTVDSSEAAVAFRKRRRQPAFDLWSQVFGMPPPVPGVSLKTGGGEIARLTALRDAYACFRGIKRPIGDDDTGANIIVYITKPSYYFVYEPSFIVAAPKRVPPDVLFAIYVKLAKEYGVDSPIPRGTVTHWGFGECDPNDKLLPRDWEKRYDERLW